jgi:hypothetical protein
MPRLTKKSLTLFMTGLAEAFTKEPPSILDDASWVSPVPSKQNLELASVAHDRLVENGFDLVALREHLRPTKLPLVAMGRLVGATGVYNVEYGILRQDLRHAGGRYHFTFYDLDSYVYVISMEIVQAIFSYQMSDRRAPPPKLHAPEHVPLRSLTPDRWAFSMATVVIPETISRVSDAFVASNWVQFYDLAIPASMKTPDLSEFASQLRLF